MNVLCIRHDHTLLAELVRLRGQRARFGRLLADRPTGIQVQTRAKAPGADLKRRYPKALLASAVLSGVLNAVAFLVFPTFDIQSSSIERMPVVLNLEDVPETRQVRRPPPLARPAVPIETESEDVPEDVTIATTDLDLDRVPVNLPVVPGVAQAAPEVVEEETLDFWKVEEKPQLVKQVIPEYPWKARRGRLEGSVFLKVLVGSDGRVKDASVIRGLEVFRQAALNAVYQFVFSPAQQNDKPVDVWMVIPMQFRLTS